MTTFGIYFIEITASLGALACSFKRPITIPLFFLFLNILFASQYIGRFNIPTLVFLIPALLSSVLILYRKKEIVFKIDNFKPYAFFIVIVISISLTHLIMWNQLPIFLIKLSLLSLCFGLLFLRDFHSYDSKEFINVGTFLFLLATVLLIPQAFKFYSISSLQGLGRMVSGGLSIDHSSVNTWAVIPTVIKEENIVSSLFSLGEKATYYYLTLSSIFFVSVFFKFLINPFIMLGFISASFALVHVSSYVNLMLGYHLQLAVTTVLIFYYYRDKLTFKKSASTFILLIAINISAFILTASSDSFMKKIVDTYYSPSQQVKERKGLVPKTSIEIYKINVLTRDQVPKKRDKSRLFRIKDAIKKLISEYPFTGIGDRSNKGLVKRDKAGVLKFSNHSFLIDSMVSFGLFFGTLFLFVPFFYTPINILRKIKSSNSTQIKVWGVLFSLSLVNSSMLGNFGVQPFHVGFLLFSVTLIRTLMKVKMPQKGNDLNPL